MHRGFFQIRETKKHSNYHLRIKRQTWKNFYQERRAWSNMPRFLPNIYQHKEVPEDAIREILEDLPRSFTVDMNISLSKEITENEFFWPFTQ